MIAQTNRNAGLVPAEITLEGLEDLTPDSDFDFDALKSNWIQAMDQRELRQIAGADPQYLFPFSYAPHDLRTIPVVLDQTRDGNYRYLGKDGKPRDLVISDNPDYNAAFPRPDWIDAYEAGRTLPDYNGAPILAQQVTNHLARVFAEVPAVAAATVPAQYGWMADALAEYNEGMGFSRTDQIVHRPKAFYFRPGGSGGFTAAMDFPGNRAAPLPTRFWASVAERSSETNAAGVVTAVLDLELHFEFINPYPVPIDLKDKHMYLEFYVSPESAFTAPPNIRLIRWYSSGHNNAEYRYTQGGIHEGVYRIYASVPSLK